MNWNEWPENSNHYTPLYTWWDKHPDRTEGDFFDGFGEKIPTGTIETDDSWMEEAIIW